MKYLMGFVWGMLAGMAALFYMEQPMGRPCLCELQGSALVCPEGTFKSIQYRPRTVEDGPSPLDALTPKQRARG